MSVNIQVREGDSSRVFNNIDKVSFNNPDGGEMIDFVPEGEADKYATTTELIVKQNGVYEAKTANVVGFSKVTVQVPSTGGIQDAALMEQLVTNITSLALRPNIHQSTTSWEWNEGRQEGEPVRTFTSTAQSEFEEHYEIAGKNAKVLFNQLVKPESYASIPESDTELLVVDGKQLYFVSISDFTKGFTTVPPKSFNDKITDYVADMYKCRRLKTVGSAQTRLNLYTNGTSQTVETDTVFNTNVGCQMGAADVNYTENTAEKTFKVLFTDTNGIQHGYKITEDKTNGGVSAKIIKEGVELEALVGKIYASQAEADADIGVVPADTIAIIKMGE